MPMNGAESLVRTLALGGVKACFANPGTSEIHIVAALDHSSEIRCILGLFEGVVTGAADGYARMSGKPAATLLHLGPGFGNGIANLHNAFRAHSPILNLVGQHALSHLRHDAPLTSDIQTLARPYSQWLRTCCSARELGVDTSEAIAAARTAPGRIATLIIPADTAWEDGGAIGNSPNIPIAPAPANVVIEQAASMLRSGIRTAILLGGTALSGPALVAAGRIAESSNAKLFAPYPISHLQRGAGLPAVERVQYILELAQEQFREFRQLILVGAPIPVAYFAYPGKSSEFIPSACKVLTLSRPEEDGVGALDALLSLLPVQATHTHFEALSRPSRPTGSISLEGLSRAVGAVLPENAIVVDESMTSGRGLMAATQGCPPHDWLGNTGGSIGIALPLAVGAAVACPDRPVLCLTADGSGMYTPQALWTMAREGLNVTTVVYANRSYNVLKREFSYLGIGEPGPRAADLFDIGRPALDWLSLAKAMGVPACPANSLESFVNLLENGLRTPGPSLIQVDL
jgi:acetolactate synthase I/II/III large subunit